MLERWNPTVKAFTVLVCVILLSFEYLVSLNLLVPVSYTHLTLPTNSRV